MTRRSEAVAASFNVRDQVSALCFCGRRVTFGFLDRPGDEDDGRPIAMHAEPSCADFDQRDVLAYLQWLNRN